MKIVFKIFGRITFMLHSQCMNIWDPEHVKTRMSKYFFVATDSDCFFFISRYSSDKRIFANNLPKFRGVRQKSDVSNK